VDLIRKGQEKIAELYMYIAGERYACPSLILPLRLCSKGISAHPS